MAPVAFSSLIDSFSSSILTHRAKADDPYDAPMCDQSSQSSGFGPAAKFNTPQSGTASPSPPRNSTLPCPYTHCFARSVPHGQVCFVNMPSWTLDKTMYMFDVHGVETHKNSGTEARRDPSTDTVDGLDLDSESESQLLLPSPPVDDSDGTLVEDGDLERDDYSTFEASMSGAGPSSPSSSIKNSFTTPRFKCVSPTVCPTKKPSSNCPLSLSLYAQISLRDFFHPSMTTTKPWETKWSRRWEVLLVLTRSNWDRQLFAALSINEYPCCAEQLSWTNGDAEVAGRNENGV
ncbi:hypothetical protein M378DRAFT_23105 [Amanita muscaria Koide BX008]|uniref:Uncharacterized protein n=1 Tax=Amanita muscaria (strain Koide BX008) TaxID=946122 RepID=A0A0C2TIB3_AMAMK|nr:hypothetical protein M378DRAFT_23105 [Amanita muscaria Koide BX008]